MPSKSNSFTMNLTGKQVSKCSLIKEPRFPDQYLKSIISSPPMNSLVICLAMEKFGGSTARLASFFAFSYSSRFTHIFPSGVSTVNDTLDSCEFGVWALYFLSDWFLCISGKASDAAISKFPTPSISAIISSTISLFSFSLFIFSPFFVFS